MQQRQRQGVLLRCVTGAWRPTAAMYTSRGARGGAVGMRRVSSLARWGSRHGAHGRWARTGAGAGVAAVAAIAAVGAIGIVEREGAQSEAASAGEENDSGLRMAPEHVASSLQYPANKPIEDRARLEQLKNGAWWFSVFDGHGGWQCSDWSSRHLHLNLEQAMANHQGHRSEDDDLGLYEGKVDRRLVTKALKSAFERTDRQYMVKVFGAFELGFGRDTRAGSCALGALILDGVLFVANAGDSRGVLAVNRKAYEANSALKRRKSRRGSRKVPESGPNKVSEEEKRDLSSAKFDVGELMGQAALRDSVGEDLTPEIAEKLRALLLKQVFEMRKSENDKKVAAQQEASSAKVQQEEEEKSSEGDSNPFVTAVRLLTGGTPEAEKVEESEFVAIDMSNDHNCRERREREQLERMHPGEKDVVVCRKDSPDQCYIKGKLQPTRAFGDFYLKYPEFMRESGSDAAAGRYVPPPYTPPYISATPEVQVRSLRKGVDEFLVMGTDGLWDMMSSQEAIDIVGEHLREPGGTPAKASEALIEECLRRAARAHGLTTSQLRSLKAGRARRTKHDDISVIVVDLARLVELHYWG